MMYVHTLQFLCGFVFVFCIGSGCPRRVSLCYLLLQDDLLDGDVVAEKADTGCATKRRACKNCSCGYSCCCCGCSCVLATRGLAHKNKPHSLSPGLPPPCGRRKEMEEAAEKEAGGAAVVLGDLDSAGAAVPSSCGNVRGGGARG